MALQIEHRELSEMLECAVEIGFKKGLMIGQVSEVKLKPYLCKKEAGRIYGVEDLKNWIKKGLVKEIKDGENNSKVRLDRIQLEIVAATSNRGL